MPKTSATERRSRELLILNIEAAMQHWSVPSCGMVCRNAKFGQFLIYLGNRSPDDMRKILKKTLRVMPAPSGKETEKKRQAADGWDAESSRAAKRAKADKNKRFGEWAFGVDHGAGVRCISGLCERCC